jgi:hypothetical protein
MMNTTQPSQPLTWKLDHTFAVKKLGRDNALYWYSYFALPGFIPFFMSLVFITILIQALAIELVVDWIVQLVCSAFLTIVTVIFLMFHSDMNLTRQILWKFSPLVNLALAIVGTFNFSLTMNHLDTRAVIIPPFCLGTLFVLLLDTYPKHAKVILTLPSLLSVVIVNVVIVVMIALRRYPLYLDYTYDLGDIGGLSSAPITYSARELASSSIFANCVLSIRMLVISTWNRHTINLVTLSTPLQCVSDETDADIFQYIFAQRGKKWKKESFSQTSAVVVVVNNESNI